LNNLTPTEFLAEYWQKKPLLIRQAIPGFEGLLTPNKLAFNFVRNSSIYLSSWIFPSMDNQPKHSCHSIYFGDLEASYRINSLTLYYQYSK